MKQARVWIMLVFGGLASLAFFAGNSDAKPETVAKIADGVWFREGDLKNLGHCNNIVIEMKDYLIVVDANFPSGARAALADAKKVSSKPDRKSTRLNSSHSQISYAVFCLKKKKGQPMPNQ